VDYLVILFAGMIAGVICTLLYVWPLRRDSLDRMKQADRKVREAQVSADDANALQARLIQELEQVAVHTAELSAKKISYDELARENLVLKRDLQNLDVNLHKIELDGEIRDKRQAEVDARSNEIAKRYLNDTVKSVSSSISSSNYAASKARLTDAIERVRGIGFHVSESEEEALLADLRAAFEKAVRLEFQRQEQARIKAQIREEERLKREIDREMRQLERERLAIQAALDQALAQARGEHTAEVDALKARLAEAEEKSRRTLSMAQQTRAGHVYVISNIGTMGEGIYKIGMTRRLVPMERVKELGDASVPFPFDVHMMISCSDAPKLENALHKAFHKYRLNKTNPRKEFFRTNFPEIIAVVEENHGTVDYVADPEALEYRQSILMSEADAEVIEEIYDSVDDEIESIPDDE